MVTGDWRVNPKQHDILQIRSLYNAGQTLSQGLLFDVSIVSSR